MKKLPDGTYGTTSSGVPITDQYIAKTVFDAEAGFQVDELVRRRRVGRPPIGSGAATVESVRLDPELGSALRARADRDRETASAVIRKALRAYLGLSQDEGSRSAAR